MSLNFTANNPIEINNEGNDINIIFKESDIVNDGLFSGSEHKYTGNINSINVDRFGRVLNVETGTDIISPNEISYLKINNDIDHYNLQLTKNSATTEPLTINTDDKIISDLSNGKIELKLSETGIVNEDNITFDIKTSNLNNGNDLLIKKATDTIFLDNIEIYKGKTYIFRQRDIDSTNLDGTLSSQHAIGISTSHDYIEPYLDAEYYINEDGKIYSSGVYYGLFLNRNVNSNPYIKFKLPNDFNYDKLYFYSISNNSLNKKITINIKNNIETKVFNNIKDVTIDKHGRIIEISNNEIPFISKFDIALDDNNKKTILNYDDFKLSGFDNHINTQLDGDNIILKLKETGVINSLNLLNNKFYIVLKDNIIKKNNTFSSNYEDYDKNSIEIYSGYEYIFNQVYFNKQPIKIVKDEISNSNYTDNVNYYSLIDGEYKIVTLDTYINNVINTGVGYIKLKTDINTPKKLYLAHATHTYSYVKLPINTIKYTKQFDGVLSITTDQFGRLHDIATIDEIYDVNFTITISHYTINSFDVTLQRELLEAFAYYFLNIEFNDIFIDNISNGNNAGELDIIIKIYKISSSKKTNLLKKINDLINDSDIMDNFKNILTDVKKMANFNNITLTPAIDNLVDNNSIYINNFTIKAGNDVIDIKNMTTLEFINDGIIDIKSNSLNRSLTFELSKIKNTVDYYDNFVKKITIDEYGRVTNLETGDIELPNSGVTVNDTETFTGGISSITVNNKGFVTNIETTDFMEKINNNNNDINNKLNDYISLNNSKIEEFKNDYELYVLKNNSENVINKTTIQNNNITIINEIERAKNAEGNLNVLNTAVKKSLVDSINYLNTKLNNHVSSNNADFNNITLNFNNKITALENTTTVSLNNVINDIEINNSIMEKIGNLNNYNKTYNLISFLGDLSKINSSGTIEELINKIGLLNDYTEDNTLIEEINTIKNNLNLIDDDILNSLKKFKGHKNLFSVIGLNQINNRYSYGPDTIVQQDPFYRDGFYPLFTSVENLNIWKNENINNIINNELFNVDPSSSDFSKLNEFRNEFKGITISPLDTSNIVHSWEYIKNFEIKQQVYFTIRHDKFPNGNPTITFTDKYNIVKTITFEIDNLGNSKKNIINDISNLISKMTILESTVSLLNSNANIYLNHFKKLIKDYVKFNENLNITTKNYINVYSCKTVINSNGNITRYTSNLLYDGTSYLQYETAWLIPFDYVNPSIIIDIDLSNFTDGFTLFFQLKNVKKDSNIDNLLTIISQEKNTNDLHKTIYSITDTQFKVNDIEANFDGDFKYVDTDSINDSMWNVFISFIPDVTTMTYNEFDEKVYTTYTTQLLYKKSLNNVTNYSKKLNFSNKHFNKSWLIFGQSFNNPVNNDANINDISSWVNGDILPYESTKKINCNCDLSNIIIFDKKIDINDIINFNNLTQSEINKLF